MRLLALSLVLVLAFPARAQIFQRLFNPDVQVELTHPPGLGIQVKRVAFAPTEYGPSEDFVAACIADLVATGQIDVMDRGTTSRILSEQKFSASGMVDTATAVQMGKVLGSPMLMILQVNTFRTKRDRAHKQVESKDKEGRVVINHTYISKVRADFTASVQAVDTATGRIYSARRLVYAPERENTSAEGYPEYPGDLEVKEAALRTASTEVMRILLPWKERRKLIFYDDKDYGMKVAHHHLQAGDYAGALQKARESVRLAKEDPGVKSKYLGRTQYNLGMCLFILGDYDAALPELRAARLVEPGNGIFRESQEECEKALALRAEMAQVESRSVAFAAGKGAAGNGAAGNGAAGIGAAAPPTPATKPSLEDRLARLDALYKRGLLTEKEYQDKKAELMKEL